jgi:hypothetical protein
MIAASMTAATPKELGDFELFSPTKTGLTSAAMR